MFITLTLNSLNPADIVTILLPSVTTVCELLNYIFVNYFDFPSTYKIKIRNSFIFQLK